MTAGGHDSTAHAEPASQEESVVKPIAATLPCRGLLPVAVCVLALAGCGIDAEREAGDPDDPAPAVPAPAGDSLAAAAAPAAGAGAAVPAPVPAGTNAAPAATPGPAADPAATLARGDTAGAATPQAESQAAGGGAGVTDAPDSSRDIVYHVVKGARFFDILVARIGNREHVVIGETDDMCLDLPDQRDFDGDGRRDALVFRSPRCRGDAAPGLLFFVFADKTFRLSDPFPGHRPRVERWNGEWSVLAGETRHVLRDGRAVRVNGIGSGGRRGPLSDRSRR